MLVLRKIKQSAEDDNENNNKKRKRIFSDLAEQELPEGWKHLRLSHHKVRPEYYQAIDLLISKHHLTYSQGIAAVVVVGQIMFGRPWKFFDEDKECIDLDTAPHHKNQIIHSKAVEAFTISRIVKEIMKDDKVSSTTYHDDGSKTQGTGSYSVQGVTIGGSYYPLPTLQISSETRTNLAELKLTILSLLALCGDVPREEIWKRIDFCMTDSTAHNFGVDDIVAGKLNVEHTPSHLLCQTHPSLMFNRVMTSVFKDIDTAIGSEKIFAAFAVSLGEQATSVTEIAIDCTLRLVSHDFDSKPWNKASDFDLFIAPKKNNSKRLQQERFNSFVYCCAVFLNLDKDVTAFLEFYPHITNQLACVVRSFQSLDYVRVLAAVAVLLGQHLVEPFISLTSSSKTRYEKLVVAFPQLYTDLTCTAPEKLLDLSKPAFSFISEERWKHCSYKQELLIPVKVVVEENRQEVMKVMKLMLSKLAAGWERQRGDMFEFGPNANPEASNKVSEMDQQALASAPINNLDAERHVAMEKQRNNDLAILKADGGPFTSSEEVKVYYSGQDIIEKIKNKRLYIEVKYFSNKSILYNAFLGSSCQKLQCDIS